MALKYYIEYNDVVNIGHRLEIYDDDFSGTETQVDGEVFLTYAQIINLLEPIKGAGLRVELEANSGLTFEDLYTDYEKDIFIIYKRDSVIKFNGWLNPEGWYEDFVQDKWKVSFDCVDGLGFLNNLSYVDENGLNYTGKETFIKTISNCLLRTGLEQEIRTDIKIIYAGLGSVDILANAKVDANRYIKDDGQTVMSCKEVLEKVLEIFGAVIANVNAIWYIYKPNQLFLSSTINYYAYDFDGSVHTTPTGSTDIAFSLGSEINDFYPHHCSGNQSVSNEKSLGAHRISYKYGKLEGIFDNIYLDGNGTTIDDWTIDSMTNLFIPPTGRGIDFTAVDLDTQSIKQMTSDSVPLLLNEIVDLQIKVINTNWYTPSANKQETFVYRVKNVGASTLYYNSITDNWSVGTYSNTFTLGKGLDTITEILRELTMPQNGDLTIELWSPYSYLSTDPTPYDPKFQVFIQEVSLTTVEQNAEEGEFNTVWRKVKPNSTIEDVKEVFNGDNLSATYLGTIYKFDEITLTNTWNRTGVSETPTLLRLLGEEILRLNASTKRIFTGNVFGFFDYLSVVSIDGFTGYFLVTQYDYSTKNNIISAQFKQIFGAELTDIGNEKILDYGETEKPTIKG